MVFDAREGERRADAGRGVWRSGWSCAGVRNGADIDACNVSTDSGAGRARAFFQFGCALAGKSGTAQTGKGEKVNRWFAGYFPYENPRYALVVVDIETDNVNVVTPAFAEMVEAIHQLEIEK